MNVKSFTVCVFADIVPSSVLDGQEVSYNECWASRRNQQLLNEIPRTENLHIIRVPFDRERETTS